LTISGATPGVTASLRRELGLLDAIGIGVGAIVGAGIFVVLGVAAGIAGPSLLVGLLIAGVAASANALSSAQLAAAYPFAGGTYEYGYRVIGPRSGFAAGWMFLAGKTAALGTVALGIGGYLSALVPGLPPRAVAVAAVAVFTVLNYRGMRRSSQVNLVVVAISIGSLVALVVVGGLGMQSSNFTPFAPGGVRALLESAALLFFAYTGYARIATLGEEVRDPARTIPHAIVLTIGGTVFLYFAVAVVALGAVGSDALGGSAAPLERAARAAGGPALAAVLAAGGLVAMLGVVLSQLLGLSRMAFAMARRGDLPAWVDAVHSVHGVPHRAVVLMGAVGVVIAATGSLREVAAAASFTILVYYGIANVAAYCMPRSEKLFPNLVPIVGMIACVVLALSLPVRTIAIGLGVLATGFAARWTYREFATRILSERS
jgi:APA family basic amino acid/polyamine antiporter